MVGATCRAVGTALVTCAALLLAAACGGGGDRATPTPTPVVLPQGGASFEPLGIDPPRPGLIDLRQASDANLRAIEETVERYEQLRHQWECSLSLEGFPVREVATEKRIAVLEQYLAGQREIGLCEVITTHYRARLVLLQADQAIVYADRRATIRYFDPRTGEEVKEPRESANLVGWVLVPAGDGRWLVDEIGVVQQPQ